MSADPRPRMVRLLDAAYDQPPRTPRFRILVVSTPRSGSSWLMDVLQRAGATGPGDEYLHPDIIRHSARQQNGQFDPAGFLDALEPRRCGPDGTFALKFLLAQSAQSVPAQGAARLVGTVLQRFDRIVFLRRKDKVAQGLSFYIAGETQIFQVASDAERAEVYARRAQLGFSYPRLTGSILQVSQEDAAAEHALASRGLGYYEVYYEDLLADPASGFAQLAAYLGLPATPDPGLAQTRQLRDRVSEALRRDYIAWLTGDY